MKNTAIIYNAIIEKNLLTADQCNAIIEKTGDLPFHTFKYWNDHGYQVKRGSHAKITCYLWKYSSKSKALTEEEKEELKNAYMFEGEEPPQTIENGNFYRVKSYLFDITQVEKRIKAETKQKEPEPEEPKEPKKKTARAKKSAPAQATKAETILLNNKETTRPAYIAGNGLEYIICPVKKTQ